MAKISWAVSSPRLKVKDRISTFDKGLDIPLNISGSRIPKGMKITMLPIKLIKL
ncbi:hypothetical protein D3C86_1995630 [compost metagenome]